MKVITISGHAQHGKDTAARMIEEELVTVHNKKVLIAHYADLLKYICKTFFGWDGRKDDNGREILQYVGTDVIRNKSPDFWVNFIIEMLSLFGDEWDYVLIPDTRFPNEISRLKESGYDVVHIRIVRPDYDNGLTEEQQRHPSETALDGTKPDVLVVNDGTLDDLRWMASKLIEEEII